MPGIVWITLIYVAVFASAATVVLLQYAALVLPSSKVMAYTYLVPAWVILWTVALGEALPPAGVTLGIGLIVAALLMLLREETPRDSAGPAQMDGHTRAKLQPSGEDQT